MKMKVVIKVSMNDQKSKKKALKTIVGCFGVESMAVQGSDKLEVIGEGIDAVEITTSLRKRVGFSEIVSVGEVKKEEKKEDAPKPVVWTAQPYAYNYNGYNTNYTVPYQPIYEVKDSNSESCSIM